MVIKFRFISKAFLYIATAVYPILVFYFLIIHKMPIRVLSLFVIAFALLVFILRTSKKSDKKSLILLMAPFLLLGVGILCLAFDSAVFFKFYPLLMNILFLGAFGITLFKPPSMIYRFALIQDKSIPNSPREKEITSYCRKVTIIWIVFFAINGHMAAWSIFLGSNVFWAVYNGGVSYVLMGILWIGELIVRRMVYGKILKAVPCSSNAGIGKTEGVKVMEKTGDSVVLEFSIPNTSPYFDGHFPDFPILPAVAQVELVVRFASEFLGTGIDVCEIRRIKLINPILPDTPLSLGIEKKEKDISFKMNSPESKTVYSSGTMVMRENCSSKKIL